MPITLHQRTSKQQLGLDRRYNDARRRSNAKYDMDKKSAHTHKLLRELEEETRKVEQQQVEAFAKVDDQVVKIGHSMDTVIHSIGDQQNAVKEIAQAIANLDANIQSNAALVEESSAAAISLKEQAELLHSETSQFVIDEVKAVSLTQDSNAVFGVKFSDVRKNMRLWRTNAQTFLNGIPAEIDMEKAIHPDKCAVGLSLAKVLAAEPSIQQLPEYLQVLDLHVQQHNLVKQALTLMEGDQHLTIDELKEKDNILDNFVIVTDALDGALGNLNKAIHRQYGL